MPTHKPNHDHHIRNIRVNLPHTDLCAQPSYTHSHTHARTLIQTQVLTCRLVHSLASTCTRNLTSLHTPRRASSKGQRTVRPSCSDLVLGMRPCFSPLPCCCVEHLKATQGSSSRKYLSHFSPASRGTKSVRGHSIAPQHVGHSARARKRAFSFVCVCVRACVHYQETKRHIWVLQWRSNLSLCMDVQKNWAHALACLLLVLGTMCACAMHF